jgi:hypothetical protein
MRSCKSTTFDRNLVLTNVFSPELSVLDSWLLTRKGDRSFTQSQQQNLTRPGSLTPERAICLAAVQRYRVAEELC